MSDKDEKDIAVLQKEMIHVEERGIKSECRAEFVTKDRHRISESLIFGFVGLVLTAFVVFLLSLAIKR